MAPSSLRFLSVDRVCRRVDSLAEVMETPNSLYRPPHEPMGPLRPPDFFDPADAGFASQLSSPERCRDTFGLGFDDSHDQFLARLDDVVVEHRSIYDVEVFRIFVDRGVAISEPYNSHYKADWPLFRSVDAITLDVNGTSVPVYLHDEIEPEAVIEEPVLFLLDKRIANYYHWMCEVLPRLWAREALPALAPVPLLVNRDPLTPFRRQTLAAVAAGSRLMPFTWRAARFKRLYLPSFIAAGETGRRLRPWFDHLRTRLGIAPKADSPKRLYISRAGAAHRRVVNDGELANELAKIGFASVALEKLSVGEQLNLFAGAEAVVLPHGAAGANLPAARKGTLVVECHASTLLNPTYWLLAQAMEQPYGIAVSGAPHDGKPDFMADMTIDAAKLLRVVEAGLRVRTAQHG